MNAIYISNLIPSYLTLEFQREVCKRYCKKYSINNYIIIENDIQKLVNNLKMYNNVVLYTLACLGNNYDEIDMKIKQIMKNTNLESIFEPLLVKYISKTSKKLVINFSINLALHQNDIWEDLNLLYEMERLEK